MRIWILVAACAALTAGDTKFIEVTKRDHFMEGEELSGVVVTANQLRLGFASQSVKLPDEQSAYSGCLAPDGALLVGTGSGKIYTVKDGKTEVAFDTGEQLVTDMILSEGHVFAATIPHGKIFKMKNGEWKEFAKVESTHAWSLIKVADKLLVGCGKPAKLFEIDKDGTVKLIYSPKADHIFSVSSSKDKLLLGTANPGYLISFKDNKPFVMFDFGNSDVKSIVTLNDSVYVAVNQKQGSTPPELLKCVKPLSTKDTPKEPSKDNPKDKPSNGGSEKPKDKPTDEKPDSPFKDKPTKESPDKKVVPIDPQESKDKPSNDTQEKKEKDPITGKWEGTNEIEFLGQKNTVKVSSEMVLDGKNVIAVFREDKQEKPFDLKGIFQEKKVSLEGTVQEKIGDTEIKISVKLELSLVKEDTLEGDFHAESVEAKSSGKLKLTRVEKSGGSKTNTPKTTNNDNLPDKEPSIPVTTGPTLQSLSSVWKFTDSMAEAICETSFYITSIAATSDGLFIASNQSGRVFNCTEKTPQLYYDFEGVSSVNLITNNSKLVAVLLAEPGAVGFPSLVRAKSGTFVSKSFDTKFLSKVGNVTARCSGGVELYIRGGNTLRPEDGWSDWIGPITKFPTVPSMQKVRFIQFKLVLIDEKAVVEGVSIAYKSDNQRPKLLNVQLPPPPSMLHTSSLLPNPSLVGTKINRVTLKTIIWQAQDPDSDILVYRLFYRKIDSSIWAPLNEAPLSANQYMWNTEEVPDGKYVFKVVASDETSNSHDALQAEAESDVITIDNTKPEIKITGTTNGTITGTVSDNLSNIVKLQYQVDGGEWESIKPDGGMFDSKGISFKISTEKPLLGKGQHVVTILATDQESNIGVTSVTIDTK